MSTSSQAFPVDASDVRTRGLAETLLRLAQLVLFGLLPALLLLVALREHGLGWDFRAYYVGARAYLEGASPYPAHSLAALAGKQEFVYPAPMAALFAPFALLPYAVSLSLWLIGSVAAIVIALRILGVRDWRCFGALFLTDPVREGVRLGTVMPLLMLLLALLWRHRDRVLLAAVLAAVIAVSKVFLVPLLIWLAATRRWRTATMAAVFAACLCLIGWLPIHFSTLTTYPALLHALASFEQTFSYSLTSFVVGLGFSSSAATAIALAAGAALLAWAVAVGRTDDFLSFRLGLAASLVLSPIVWGHYYTLLAVPLAIRWPRLSPVWLAAAWIRSDTLALPDASVWVALALLVMVIQLDLVKLVGRRPLTRATPPVRAALATVLTLVLPAAAVAASAEGLTFNATLRPTIRSGAWNGAASVRVDLPDRWICWRIWTEGVSARRAVIAIEKTKGAQRPLVLHTRIGSSGQAQGCAQITRRAVRGVVDRTGRYRLVVTAPGATPISGSLRSS